MRCLCVGKGARVLVAVYRVGFGGAGAIQEVARSCTVVGLDSGFIPVRSLCSEECVMYTLLTIDLRQNAYLSCLL